MQFLQDEVRKKLSEDIDTSLLGTDFFGEREINFDPDAYEEEAKLADQEREDEFQTFLQEWKESQSDTGPHSAEDSTTGSTATKNRKKKKKKKKEATATEEEEEDTTSVFI